MVQLVERIPRGRRDFHILKPYNVWNLRPQVLELELSRVNLWTWWWLKCKADYQKVHVVCGPFFCWCLILVDFCYSCRFQLISADSCWFLFLFLQFPQIWGVVSRQRVGDINPTSIAGKRTFDWILTSLKGSFSSKWSSFTFVGRNGYCWWREFCTSWYGDYPIFHRVFIDNRRLAGFLPSIAPPQNRIISVMLLLLGPRNKDWPRSLSSKIIFAKHFGRGRHYLMSFQQNFHLWKSDFLEIFFRWKISDRWLDSVFCFDRPGRCNFGSGFFGGGFQQWWSWSFTQCIARVGFNRDVSGVEARWLCTSGWGAVGSVFRGEVEEREWKDGSFRKRNLETFFQGLGQTTRTNQRVCSEWSSWANVGNAAAPSHDAGRAGNDFKKQ